MFHTFCGSFVGRAEEYSPLQSGDVVIKGFVDRGITVYWVPLRENSPSKIAEESLPTGLSLASFKNKPGCV